jgi:YspA, cpYpsA-related SLOG family
VKRQLEDNEDRQKRAQEKQDGSEVRSVELERLIAQGQDVIERRELFEQVRDFAAECYETATGSAWRPRAGSLVNHNRLTAAMIDSRDFIAARRTADTELLLPKGPKIAFSGGTDYANHKRIWSVLDQVHAKHPDMVLIHGGTPKGAERAAACWADKRGITQITFKPDWVRDGKAAPFKRNDRMLEIMPKGVIVFPGSGITSNLADKAKKLGIPMLDHRERGA